MGSWTLFDDFFKKKPDDPEKRFDAQEPGAIHREPDCLGYNRCRVMEPHKHGFACDKTCNECWGLCHPDCPANESIKKEKRGT